MSGLPLRLRLTLAFAVAMAVVLGATGAFLYVRLASSLDEAVDESLEARAAEVAPLVARGDAGLGRSPQPAFDAGERFGQVLAPDGRVLDESPQLEGRPLLDRAALARAGRGVTRLELDHAPGMDGPARVLATPVKTSRGKVVLVLGASLEDRDEAVRGFLTELALVGPAALLLASLLGYGLASAALRPVESMRTEAASISASEPGRRLPLPHARDEVFRLGETLNGMLERLQGALERERSFVADASHELRTPLAILKAELELALSWPRSQRELEEALRSAAAEADRLAELADDLLVLARADQGRLPLRPETVAVRDLVTGVAERFARRARAAGRAIEVEAPDALRLAVDRLRIEQALANLVENALRHADGTIRLTAAERDGTVEFHVSDEGRGFPPEFLPRAFDRFSRGDDARSGEGAGLGLTIADLIARAHGGSSHAVNRETRGADVWLSVPKSRSTGRRAPAPEPNAPPPPSRRPV